MRDAAEAPDNLTKRPAPENSNLKPTGVDDVTESEAEDSEPPTKKVKIETPKEETDRKDEEGGRETGEY